MASQFRHGFRFAGQAGWMAIAVLILAAVLGPAIAPAAVAAEVSTEPTHEQTKIIKPAGKDRGLALTAFCLTKEGNIVAVLNKQDAPVAGDSSSGGVLSTLISAFSGEAVTVEVEEETGESEKPADKAAPSVAEVRVLDADGKQLAVWPLDFKAQAVNVCADGSIVLGGDGIVARFDRDGKQVTRADSPQIAGAATSRKELEDNAREALKGQFAAYEEALKELKKQKEEISKKKDEELTEEEKMMKAQADVMIQAYTQAMAQAKEPSEEQVQQMADYFAGRQRTINAIAAGENYVFVTCADPKGYGYSVWRTDFNFENPKQIVTGLSGCCGQMDVQCCGDELVVAENSRKRVVRYDADGKQVASFGKASRDGLGDTFGSCCNPMNTRWAGGKLYVSDSDGRVRLFSLEGGYEGEVGKAKVREGCKSSIVEVSPDGNRIYYIDVNNSQICVLDRKSAEDRQAAAR